ncbi:MAG: CusA/CzcA family heavy metal efflux RND transporter [Halothiobacillus sp. 24-54-40]|jgi:Cu(I)/Ag(I) efflux system membrane protein CusA/SilA|nr:MAG: CusA/CzcA family heavy metal efflux RND transporter [Halothiobacillus sp. 20-53-49]OYY40605.1 MAG: CusA/CzcA family heavy metal efflux RND transporter [Halothiobacillus sp. 35-54-62]OYZ87189.1 MAG: CusA/CzcA family heavy metal efflux RND transporter [Halothiobacillus sp. 24-54-40]OZA80773.1 MAG: CusA/CzcA family heavy metal efflux RND transporter [Halothiobacillus sp. 39-53-45]HQS03548.1 efflux RND transporter permease subunit [Halothiobacillus sp.]
MLKSIIEASIKNRVLVLLLAAILAVVGWYSWRATPLDAIPDLSDTQVIIKTSYPGQSPQVVQDQVTYPLTTTLLSVPGSTAVRGYSFYGDSYIYVTFKDGTDLYWARSRVLEYLNQAKASLPAGVNPQLGPDATGVGWVYEYALTDPSGTMNLSELTTLQNWFMKFQLQTVPGVAEVATVGGMVQEYQIVVDPDRLRAFGVSLDTLRKAVAAGNQEVGGGVLELGGAEYMVTSRGYLKSVADIERIPVGVTASGTPILVRDLGTVRLGPASRRGVADLDGKGEVVGGIIVMRSGENARSVIEAVKTKLEHLKPSLPKGVEIVPVYDRSGVIDRAVDTLSHKLVEEFIVVALVCIIFLWHFRSAMVAIISLPLGVLMAFIVMHAQGINANIMSLGGIAIAIGAMVDAAIVLVENTHRHLSDYARQHGAPPVGEAHWQLIAKSSGEVGPALFFSLLIITLSFIPVFTLQAQEGRMFAPLAFTKTYAMAAAAGLAVTLVPVLMGYFIRGRIPDEHKNPLNRGLIALYRPMLTTALRFPKTLVGLSLVFVLSMALPLAGVGGYLAPLKWVGTSDWQQRVSGWQSAWASDWAQRFAGLPKIAELGRGLGSEFMPTLDEGDLLYMPTTAPGLSIGDARLLLQQVDALIASEPEVKSVFGKIGRADTATDPAPLEMIETTIQFKPQSEWPAGMTLQKIIDKFNAKIQFPGLNNAWVMPIKTRIDMQTTGIQTPIGAKITGPDLSEIARIGQQVQSVLLHDVPGTRTAYAEQTTGGRYIEITPDRVKAARFGLNIGDIQTVIDTAVGGAEVTQTVEGLERFPVSIRYPRADRDSIEALKNLPIVTPTGATVALGQVASIAVTDGPPMIRSEDSRPAGFVFVTTQGIDLGTYVSHARTVVDAKVALPPGYAISWTGQYQYLERASKRLTQVVPLTLAIIFVLLFLIFRHAGKASLIMASLPFALVGGFWLLWAMNFELSIAVAVGFIALAGVAAEFGVVMLIYLDHAIDERRAQGRLNTRADLAEAIMEGAVLRVRPKAMTVAVILAGLIPILIGHGTGSEVMSRIAAPMIGGMITAPLLSMILLPVMYWLWQRRGLPVAA